MPRLLIVDDHESICTLLSQYATAQGFDCQAVFCGGDALRVLETAHFDVVLLDVMLPDMEGTEVCQSIRRYSSIPIIMISAKTEEEDRILGLDIGADDYVPKPFSPKEVMARVRAVLRRRGMEWKNCIQLAELEIIPQKHETRIGGQEIRLTPKEESLLILLAGHPGQIMNRQQLMESAWQYDSDASDRAVDTHVKRLRAKLDAVPHEGFILETIWGMGYRIARVEKK